MTDQITVECEGCEAVATGTPEELHSAGWDVPPYFDSHVTCPSCPITATIWWAMLHGGI